MAKIKYKSTKIPNKNSIYVTQFEVNQNVTTARKKAIKDLSKLLIKETIIEIVE